MLTLEQIRTQLQDRRLSVISDHTGLHYNTIRAVRDDYRHQPSYDTVRRLADYLEARAHDVQ
jgi:hypothetical protein